MIFNTMENIYSSLLYSLIDSNLEEFNDRTKMRVRMLDGGFGFKLCLKDGFLPNFNVRKIYPYIAGVETAWQLSGKKNAEWINKKAPKLWTKFTDKDGTIPGAYGYRWRSAFGRDQISMTINELRYNYTTRQLYISAWDPCADGLGAAQKKNIPCPVGFSVYRYENYLNGSVFLRSSDAFVGLPYDVLNYSLLFDALASSCGCKVNILTFTLANVHVYGSHFKTIKEGLFCYEDTKNLYKESETKLPNWSVEKIVQFKDEYVATVKNLSKTYNNNIFWNPRPEVVL